MYYVNNFFLEFHNNQYFFKLFELFLVQNTLFLIKTLLLKFCKNKMFMYEIDFFTFKKNVKIVNI